MALENVNACYKKFMELAPGKKFIVDVCITLHIIQFYKNNLYKRLILLLGRNEWQKRTGSSI